MRLDGSTIKIQSKELKLIEHLSLSPHSLLVVTLFLTWILQMCTFLHLYYTSTPYSDFPRPSYLLYRYAFTFFIYLFWGLGTTPWPRNSKCPRSKYAKYNPLKPWNMPKKPPIKLTSYSNSSIYNHTNATFLDHSIFWHRIASIYYILIHYVSEFRPRNPSPAHRKNLALVPTSAL